MSKLRLEDGYLFYVGTKRQVQSNGKEAFFFFCFLPVGSVPRIQELKGSQADALSTKRALYLRKSVFSRSHLCNHVFMVNVRKNQTISSERKILIIWCKRFFIEKNIKISLSFHDPTEKHSYQQVMLTLHKHAQPKEN